MDVYIFDYDEGRVAGSFNGSWPPQWTKDSRELGNYTPFFAHNADGVMARMNRANLRKVGRDDAAPLLAMRRAMIAMEGV